MPGQPKKTGFSQELKHSRTFVAPQEAPAGGGSAPRNPCPVRYDQVPRIEGISTLTSDLRSSTARSQRKSVPRPTLLVNFLMTLRKSTEMQVVDKKSMVGPGAFIGTDVVLKSGCIIGPNASLLAHESATADGTVVQNGARIGANAVIHAGLEVGERACVEPGAVVTRRVPPLAIVAGNPARIIGYAATYPAAIAASHPNNAHSAPGSVPTQVHGVTLHHLRQVGDLRGDLSAGEFLRDIPFRPERYFLVYNVPTSETRGEHAHHACQQFLVAVRGSLRVVADDGRQRQEFSLSRPSEGIFLPAMTWGIQYDYSADAVLLVFASHYYAASDYIRSYGEFICLSQAARSL